MRILCLVVLLGLSAGCGPGPDEPGAASQPEVMNDVNDPSRFAIEMKRSIHELPRAGESMRKPFPANWWPFEKDGIARRWRAATVPSPAEKYDLLVSAHQIRGVTLAQARENERHQVVNPGGGLPTPMSLGPAALWEMQEHGRWGDVYPDNWWGHCNGWSSYTLNEDEPQRPVIARMAGGEVVQCERDSEAGCVRFEVGDINALMTEIYFHDAYRLLGARCNTPDLSVDAQGRTRRDECRDANPASLYIVAANMLGIQRRMFIVDINYDAQVWNYPVYKYEITKLEEVNAQQAMRLIGAPGAAYGFNPAAQRFYDVTLKAWIVEDAIPPRTTPAGAELAQYTTLETYTFVLEADQAGNLLGGEWTGATKRHHPDFLWYSYAHAWDTTADDADDEDNPHLRYSIVKKILALARPAGGAPAGAKEYEAVANTAIPDNDPAGVTSTITVPDDLAVQGVRVSVEIPHTYVGDLVLTLTHLNGTATLHHREGGNADNLMRTFDVAGFGGIAAKGEWTLRVSDNAPSDTGRLVKWKLLLIPAGGGGAGSGTPHDYRGRTDLAIPDNNPVGVSDTIAVPDAFTVSGARVTLDVAHPYSGDLTVTLTHAGVSATLMYREGGSADNLERTFDTTLFNGLSSSGDWTLTVTDGVAMDTGVLQGWTLTVLQSAGGGVAREFGASPNAPIPDGSATGVSSTIRVTESMTVGRLQVAVDVQHPFVGDLVVSIAHLGVMSVLHNRGGGDADALVQTFDVSAFNGQSAAGDWTLTVSDRSSVDSGVLRSWRLIVTPGP